MNQKLMVDMCKTYGYNFSIPKIYRYGIREGFLIKNSDTGREKYIVDEVKFKEWLERGKIPDGYMALRDATKLYNIPFQVLRSRLKLGDVEVYKFGIGGDCVFYAKRICIESVVKKYHKRDKKEQSND